MGKSMNPRPSFSANEPPRFVTASPRGSSAVSAGAEVHAEGSSLEYGDLLKISRAVSLDVGRVRRIVDGDATDTPQARQVRALALEALSRAPASRRIRVAPQEAGT